MSRRDAGGPRCPHCSAARQLLSGCVSAAPPGDHPPMTDRILIVDFGSQVTQLIARRVREAGVYCEIHPFNALDEQKLKTFDPKAIILSGGPASVTETNTPRAPQGVFTQGVPVLGICYGEQAMAAQLGGQVEGGHHREFGRATIEVKTDSAL